MGTFNEASQNIGTIKDNDGSSAFIGVFGEQLVGYKHDDIRVKFSYGINSEYEIGRAHV